MSRSRSRAVLAGYVLVVAALAINAGLTVANLRAVRASVERVEHTWRVLNELQRAHVWLRDIQASKRGYLLTADPRHRAMLDRSEARLIGSLDLLQSLTADNARQQANIADLRELSSSTLNEHHKAVELRDTQGLEAAVQLVRDGPMLGLMDQAQGTIDSMEAIERELLTGRATGAEAALIRTTTAFAVATGAALLLLGGVIVLERRERLGRTRAAEALRRSDDRFRLAAEATDLGAWAFDLDSRALDWSDRCKAIFGLPGEAAVDYGGFLDAAHPDDRDAVDKLVHEALRGERGGEYHAEFRIRRLNDGAERWVSTRGRALFDLSGRAYRMIGTVLDITDRKRAEDELRTARDQAERASRAKSQFLAVLSHELRTPLNPALLEVTALLDAPETPEPTRRSLEVVRRGIELEARLVDDLLDVVRIVQGKLRVVPATIDAHELIRAALAVVGDDLRAKGLNLDLDLAARSHHVEADPARLQQVVWNLAANAAKYTPAGGTVSVRTRDDHTPGDSPALAIEVADTGAGIVAELLPRIFDPFQQGETTATRRFGGLGLGLAISRGLVEAHGGTIVATSPGPGLGSTFRIELPTVPAPRASPEAHRAGPPTAARARQRILLVEDDPATSSVMVRVLSSLGHEVTTASTLAAALERIGGGCPFDLIFSDIGLPDGSGLELMRRVSHCANVPAVALSGFGMREDVARSREAGFRAHLTKPIDFARLKRVLAELIGD